jgi:hypothetical protein
MKLSCRLLLLLGTAALIPACKDGGFFGFGGSGPANPPGAPVVLLVSPLGGEFWSGTKTISWSTFGSTSNVRIQFSPDSGATWIDVAASTPDTGWFTWNTALYSDSSSSRIVVERLDASGAPTSGFAESADFTLDNTAPVVTLTSPVGGEAWSGSRTISWTTVDAARWTVLIEFSSTSGATWTPLFTALSDGGGVFWDSMFVVGGPGCRMRVTATDRAGNVSAPSASSADFTLDNSLRVLDQSQSVAEFSGGAWGIAGSKEKAVAQVVTPGMTGTLTQVRVPIDYHVFGDLVLEIQGVTAGFPNGTVLASQLLPWAGLPQPGIDGFTGLEISTPLPLTAGTPFAIVIRGTDPLLQDGFAITRGPVGNPYPGGNGFTASLPNLTAWTPFGTRADLPFKTVMGP